ncbi:MAG: AmmeMemoRadiSam system protein A [Acidobacteriota bacterium]|nr:AmmeMemoRadiSam system protein A [Acidobacteriota bacterium]
MASKPTQDIVVGKPTPESPAGGPTASPPPFNDESLPPTLARRAVETFVLENRILQADSAFSSPFLEGAAACFVSIKTAERRLRGCIGTIRPTRGTLAEEIIVNAISAATRDPRFPPVAREEVPFLRYSVDVLDEPEPARMEDLDPAEFGVIVEDNTGRRRGLLLPAIEGVETASEQVQIAARKAGISSGEPLQLYRFRVRRFREAA